ncbi:MAG: hypothetical protein J6M25_05430 [Prevotella sp.]|nr:hypothetical protein [Prevotella sp.]
MKKQYRSPETLSMLMSLGNVMQAVSNVNIDNGDLDHDIPIGGDAPDGDASDSRRKNIWEDDEEDY